MSNPSFVEPLMPRDDIWSGYSFSGVVNMYVQKYTVMVADIMQLALQAELAHALLPRKR